MSSGEIYIYILFSIVILTKWNAVNTLNCSKKCFERIACYDAQDERRQNNVAHANTYNEETRARNMPNCVNNRRMYNIFPAVPTSLATLATFQPMQLMDISYPLSSMPASTIVNLQKRTQRSTTNINLLFSNSTAASLTAEYPVCAERERGGKGECVRYV